MDTKRPKPNDGISYDSSFDWGEFALLCTIFIAGGFVGCVIGFLIERHQ
jgi:hypothetical protein